MSFGSNAEGGDDQESRGGKKGHYCIDGDNNKLLHLKGFFAKKS